MTSHGVMRDPVPVYCGVECCQPRDGPWSPMTRGSAWASSRLISAAKPVMGSILPEARRATKRHAQASNLVRDALEPQGRLVLG